MARFSLRNVCRRSYPLFKQLSVFETSSSIRPLCTTNWTIPILRCSSVHSHPVRIRYYSDKPSESIDKENNKIKPSEKKSLLKRFKEMYRDYWYVLVPVHLITSAGWFGGFYYLAKSGVDIVTILESWSVSEKLILTIKDSSMGYLAISYALYKLATPLRYTVTLAGTTATITFLKKRGVIKPFIGREQLKEIYKEKKVTLIDTIKERKCMYKTKPDPFQVDNNRKEGSSNSKETLFKELQERLHEIENVKIDLENKPKEVIEIEKKAGVK